MQPVADLVVADRFKLQRLLGRGGMGSVWLAQHLSLDIPCAVKFIEGEYAMLAEAQARFEREAKAAAALRSPHVVQILDHGVWQGTPYMAMELLDGEDVGKRLARIGRMSPQECCTIVTQVTRALTKAHAGNIVHRDLKPDNIFLVRDDDREIAKVLDFGIAKAANQALEGSATKTGAMLGTPYYMSPEQAQGIKAVDHRSDLWSLAVIVYQALTGKLPFESEALGDLLVKIIVAPIPVPSQVAPDLPLSFDRWWAKAANRDPAQRYQSAKEMCDGLSLVFGQSQATDVMDRSELRAALGGGPNAGAPHVSTSPPYGAIPAGTAPLTPGYGQHPHTPQPMYGTPHPMQGTPQPGMGMQHTPQPGGQTPNPLNSTTGAPMARTFGDAAGPPKSKTGLIVGISAAVAVLLLATVGATFAMKGKKDDTSAAAGGGTATTAVVAPPPPATTAVLADPTPSATALASAAPADSATADSAGAGGGSTAQAGRPRPPVGGGVAAPPATGKGTKPAATGKPGGKPSEVDLGI